MVPRSIAHRLSHSQFFSTNQWRSVCAVTLTLKQWVTEADARLDLAREAFDHFMNLVNRHIFRAAFRKHGKRLRVIPVIEKHSLGNVHIHVAIEPPNFLSAEGFAA